MQYKGSKIGTSKKEVIGVGFRGNGKAGPKCLATR